MFPRISFSRQPLIDRQYIYRNSPAYLSLHELWTDFPNRELSGLMKGYMLAQLAFWLQQLIVINIEERRKDHWQMFTHHIVTSTLVYASYRYGYTRVGNLTLVLMDVVDLFLPVRCDLLMRFAPVFVADYVVPIGCQVSQIPWLHHSLRLDVRRIPGFLVYCTPCLVPRGVLLCLGALAGPHEWVLHRAHEQPYRTP